MTTNPHNPYRGYRPGSSKKYDPNDPHFNPMHPPDGYPMELLEAEWADPSEFEEVAEDAEEAEA